MTSEQRAYLRAAIDKAARARITPPRRRCVGCESDYLVWTLDCHACASRHRTWRKRGHFPHGRKWFFERNSEVAAEVGMARRGPGAGKGGGARVPSAASRRSLNRLFSKDV